MTSGDYGAVERVAFEAWCRTLEGHPFAGAFLNLMWKAWQARATTAQPSPEPTCERCGVEQSKHNDDPLHWCDNQSFTFGAVDRLTEPSKPEQADGVPVGWKRVPVKPTSNMLAAMSGEWHPSRHGKAREQYAAMLYAAPTEPSEFRLDCAGGSPCTDCPDKKQCQRGCIRQPEFIGNESQDRKGWKSECDAVDALLRGLGLAPERCRTEGGTLNVGRTLSLLQDGCATIPPASAAGEWSVMEQALEALEWHASRYDEYNMPEDTVSAIDALRAALATKPQAEQEAAGKWGMEPLPEDQIEAIATGEFPRWREDIQPAFVIRLARAIEWRHGIHAARASNSGGAAS